MSKVQTLRGFSLHLLTTAAEKISEQFERTIAEYEEQLRLLKEENERQRKLLDAVFNPEIRLNKTEAQPPLKSDGHPHKKLKRSLNQDQEDSPEPPQKKEDQKEPEDPLKVSVEMKSEDQEKKKLSFSEDCGEPDPPKNPGPDPSSQQETEVQTEDCSEPEADDSDTQGESKEAQSSLEEVRKVENSKTQTDKKPHRCSECGMIFQEKSSLEKHVRAHSGIEQFFCAMCDETFKDVVSLRAHMVHHGAEKPHSWHAFEDQECVSEVADDHQEETPELYSDSWGSHQVFTDLNSFLSCVGKECVFCRTERLADENHLRKKHLKEAMYFLDETTEKFVVACFCRETSDSGRSHHHCPFCNYRPYSRDYNFRNHMLKKHGITAGKIKGLLVYDVQRRISAPEERLCGFPEETESQQEQELEQEHLDAEMDLQLPQHRPGSHQVFTDPNSFLSCTAEECVFCRTERPADENHLRKKHLKEAMYFLDKTTEKFVVACFCNETSDSGRSHHHCPFCNYRPYSRDYNFRNHMWKKHRITAEKMKDRERSRALRDSDANSLGFTLLPVKSEDDEEKPQSSQLHQSPPEEMDTGADEEDPDSEENSEDSSDPETDDSNDWREPMEQLSGLNSASGKRLFHCPECLGTFQTKKILVQHMRIHFGEKPYCCSKCGKGFLWIGNLKQHMASHKVGNPSAAPGVMKDVVWMGF